MSTLSDSMDNSIYSRLDLLSNTLRKRIIQTSHERRIPHLGSCLSCLDILVNLYWKEMKCFPEDPCNGSRDRFFLSKGHASPALLHILAYRGYFEDEMLNQFGVDGSYFHEHPPKPGLIPGVEAATGSLGHGLPIATGVALANKIKQSDSRTYVIVGDGECNEGVIWEAAMFASASRLSNLTVFIDYNNWQATDRANSTLGVDTLSTKWESFGWNTSTINGHSHKEISQALESRSPSETSPQAIIANTIKGKGISFMEDNNNWHYRTPNLDEYVKAISELEGAMQ